MDDLHLDTLKKLLEASEHTRSKLDELNDEIKLLDKKLELHVQKNEYQTDQLKKIDEIQGEILKEYKKKTDAIAEELKDLSEDLEDRLGKLEETLPKVDLLEEKIIELEKPGKFIKSLGSAIVIIASILGAIYSIYEFIIKVKG